MQRTVDPAKLLESFNLEVTMSAMHRMYMDPKAVQVLASYAVLGPRSEASALIVSPHIRPTTDRTTIAVSTVSASSALSLGRLGTY